MVLQASSAHTAAMWVKLISEVRVVCVGVRECLGVCVCVGVCV